MKNFCKDLNIESEILKKKLDFLSTRAEWHEAQSENSQTNNAHQACAATLWRDAGAAALILGQIGKAKSCFGRAGNLRIRLGFWDGFYLMRLGGVDMSHTIDKYRGIYKSKKNFTTEILFGSPYQLISIIQAADSHGVFGQKLMDKAYSLLERKGDYLVGITQVPAADYVRMLRDLKNDPFSDDTCRTLLTMLLQRKKLIMAAQLDQFHWKRAQKPAALVDMDLLACGMARQNIARHLRERLSDFISLDDSVFMPLYAAELLQPSPSRDVMPQPKPF